MKVLERRTGGGFNMLKEVRVRELASGEKSPAGAETVPEESPTFDWIPAFQYVPYAPTAPGVTAVEGNNNG